MSDEAWIKLFSVAGTVILGTIGTIKYALKIWLEAQKDAAAHEANLEAKNIQLQKEVNEVKFAQLQEADKFIKVALTQVAKRLDLTTDAIGKFGHELNQTKFEVTSAIKTVTDRVEKVVSRVEEIEIRVQSVVKDIGEGKVRISGPKF